VVLTAPGYVGDRGDKQDLDNAHNGELVRRLAGDGRFAELGPLDLGGRHDGATIVVFVRRPVRSGAQP
jgi:hypothetical protein